MAASPDADDVDMAKLPLETPWPLRRYGDFWWPEPILPGVVAARAFRAEAVRRPPRQLPKVRHHLAQGPRLRHAPPRRPPAARPRPPTPLPQPPRLRRVPGGALRALAGHQRRRRVRGAPFAARHRHPHPGVAEPDSKLWGQLTPQLTHRNATDIPYSLLPERATAEGAGCKLVYVCRDPKDALVSMWIFAEKMAAADEDGSPRDAFTIEDAFELFRDGRFPGGPQWAHVSGYWEASRRRPEMVLLLRYEEMLRDPAGNVRKLAEFMGCAFSEHEEAAGVAQDILELCSIDALKNMEVNKNGTQKYAKNEAYFRKGVAGDWSNHLKPAMAVRLDKIVEDALQGSGFTFGAGAGRPDDPCSETS